MKKHKIPIVGYAIIDNYKITDSEICSIDPKIDISPDSFFQACSFSKIITAYAILILITQGKIIAGVPVNDQLKTWKIPKGDEINIYECLSMTSGLNYGEPGMVFRGYQQGQALPNLRAILEGRPPATNAAICLINPAGSNYRYSGAHFMVLQQLIEDVTNQPFFQFVNDAILIPLKMNHSTCQCPLPGQRKKNAIPGFDIHGVMVKDGWENIPSTASGGLWSTPVDMAKLALSIINAYLGKDNSLISQPLAKAMLTKQKNSQFGLGVALNEENGVLNFRKNGYNSGYYHQLIMFPHTGQGIVVMTNSAAGMAVTNEMISTKAQQLSWPAYSPHFDELVPG